MIKACWHCKKDKDETQFNWRNKAKGIRSGICRECRKPIRKQWYNRHKDTHKSTVKRLVQQKRQKLTTYIADYLKAHPCLDCGEPDIVYLEFDHVRGKKRSSISRLIMIGCSLETLKLEISKCDVRCANCHRRKTAKDRGWNRVRTGI